MDRGIHRRRCGVVFNLQVNHSVLQPIYPVDIDSVYQNQNRWCARGILPVSQSTYAFLQITFRFILRVDCRSDLDRRERLAGQRTELAWEVVECVIITLGRCIGQAHRSR